MLSENGKKNKRVINAGRKRVCVPSEGRRWLGRVITLPKGHHSSASPPAPVTSLQSFPPTGMEQIRKLYVDSEGSPAFVTGDFSDHLVETAPIGGGQSMVNIYYNPNTGLPEFEAGEGLLVYSKPPQGMKKVTNTYYNPDTDLPEFSVET